MKIGINASFLRKQDSGIGQVSANFLNMLSKMLQKDKDCFGKDLKIILYLEEDVELKLSKHFEKRVLKTTYGRDDLIRKVLWEKKVLPQAAKEDECDIFFSLYQSATVFKDIKHVMLVHDVVWRRFPQYLNNGRKKVYYKLVERAIERADQIVTISKNSSEDIAKFFNIDREGIVVSPIDCDELFKKKIDNEEMLRVLAKYGLHKGEYIFYVGGFDVRKNVEALLKAYGILYVRHNQKMEIPQLVLAGSFHSNLVPLVTDVPHVAEEVMQKNAIPKGYIKSIGFVLQEELPLIYAGAKSFCYPSLYEGFGLPVLEAMNVGCPIVTSNNSSISEIVGEEEAILIDPKNEEKIAEGLLNTIVNEEQAKRRAENANIKAKFFKWEKFTKKIMKQLTK